MCSARVCQPPALLNHQSGAVRHDTLFASADQKSGSSCTAAYCTGSAMFPAHMSSSTNSSSTNNNNKSSGSSSSSNNNNNKSSSNSSSKDDYNENDKLLTEAKEFLTLFYNNKEMKSSIKLMSRLGHVESEVSERGTYSMLTEELQFACKQAWRNAPRCVGRINWKNLQVFDARNVKTHSEVFKWVCDHIVYGTNGGNIRSTITVFPALAPDRPAFRIWNSQLLGYAGYRNADGTCLGDPLNAKLTEICLCLGWKGKRIEFELLPIVISRGDDVQWFTIPPEIVLQIPIRHPSHPPLAELKLQWYALPAVSALQLQAGGLVYPSVPFNGWYVATEVAARDLCDVQRFNKLQVIGECLGLDTSTNNTLWKDRALVEINYAVLNSFRECGVTMVDHHSVADSFMRFFDDECRDRGGCPADWVWLNSPLSSSLTPVFHQEMLNYTLKPAFAYQDFAWTASEFNEPKITEEKPNDNKSKKSLGRLNRLCNALLRPCRERKSRKLRVSIVYATETGTSERFAKLLHKQLSDRYTVNVCVMDQYKLSRPCTVLLVIASTFGNGDAPANGAGFYQALVNSASSSHNSSKIFGKKRPWFSVLALGSTLYPNYCAFGKNVNQLLVQAGCQRLAPLVCADELNNQRTIFQQWCKTVGELIKNQLEVSDGAKSSPVHEDNGPAQEQAEARLVPAIKSDSPLAALCKLYNNRISICSVTNKYDLHNDLNGEKTIGLVLSRAPVPATAPIEFTPGQHLAVLAQNTASDVAQLMALFGTDCCRQVVQLQTREIGSGWRNHDRFPCTTVEQLLTLYVDIVSPPSQAVLAVLLLMKPDHQHTAQLQLLVNNDESYRDWVERNEYTLAETLNQFSSISLDLALLLSQLTTIKPRLYSISSASDYCSQEIHLTVSVKHIEKANGIKSGLCSNYLNQLKLGDRLHVYVRKSQSFSMPSDGSCDIIMLGHGVAIAPYRSFWQQRCADLAKGDSSVQFGKMMLIYGCRTPDTNLYSSERKQLVEKGILTEYTALSRQPGVQKQYVQEVMRQRAAELVQMMTRRSGHLYICGSCQMADSCRDTLQQLLTEQLNIGVSESLILLDNWRGEGRLREDIFGVSIPNVLTTKL